METAKRIARDFQAASSGLHSREARHRRPDEEPGPRPGPAGFRVNAICPGLIRTPLTEPYFAADAFEEGLRTVVPQGRAGTAADVADAAVYLASDRLRTSTGSRSTADGGWLAEKRSRPARRPILPSPKRDDVTHFRMQNVMLIVWHSLSRESRRASSATSTGS